MSYRKTLGLLDFSYVPYNITAEDVVILVVGGTGSADLKSEFIKKAPTDVSGPCASPSSFSAVHYRKDGLSLVLVDTPEYDAEGKFLIVDWVKQYCENGNIIGIIYLYNITDTDPIFTSIRPEENVSWLLKACGHETKGISPILVTTMWDSENETDPEVLKREASLIRAWKYDHREDPVRYDGSVEKARSLIETITRSVDVGVVRTIQTMGGSNVVRTTRATGTVETTAGSTALDETTTPYSIKFSGNVRVATRSPIVIPPPYCP